MSNRTHYTRKGEVLCSTTGDLEVSDDILEVSCKFCWKKYDQIEGRKVNIPELRHCTERAKSSLELSIYQYENYDMDYPITRYAYWALPEEGEPPEDIRDPYGYMRHHDDLSEKEAKKETAKMRILVGLEGGQGDRYKEKIERALRALEPVLSDPEETGSEVPSELREEVLSEAGDKCEMCGREFSNGRPNDPHAPTIDHIVPSDVGGPTERWNLRVLCRSCNSFKHKFIDPAGLQKVADRLSPKVAG